jgi:hypothetical protein
MKIGERYAIISIDEQTKITRHEGETPMTNTAIRWSGIVLIIGAVLLGVAIVLVTLNPVTNQVFSPQVSSLFLMGGILLLVSLPGMYAVQANAAGWLGLAGFALLQSGMALFVMLATPALWYPSITGPSPESASGGLLGMALTLGLLLTSIATFRARVFPRWASILLLGTTAFFFFGFFILELLPPIPGLASPLGILLAFAFAWIGVEMAQGARAQKKL